MPENFDSELIEALPAIERLAGKVWRNHGGGLRQGPEMIDDLRGEGALAFLRAMGTYDQSKGTRPMHYAYKKIYGAMLDAVRKTPIVGNATNGAGIEVSLDEFVGESGKIRRVDLLASEEDDGGERDLIRDAVAALVNKAVQNLPDRKRLIAEKLFRDGKTQREVGRDLGVSDARVGQLRDALIENLRAELTKTDNEKERRYGNIRQKKMGLSASQAARKR